MLKQFKVKLEEVNTNEVITIVEAENEGHASAIALSGGGDRYPEPSWLGTTQRTVLTVGVAESSC